MAAPTWPIALCCCAVSIAAKLPGRAAHAAAYRDRALKLATSPDIGRLFDMSSETERARDRYGRNRLGQSLLLARRLVEGGVNFVTVFDGQYNGQDANWDSHEKLFPRHGQLIPPNDRGLSALIEDLDARGLLDSTLVVAMGEFGRTPKINKSAGRDHWPDCYSVLLAGGGTIGGADLRRQRSHRRLPRTRSRNPRRSSGDHLLALRHRPGIRSDRPNRPAVPPVER